MDKLRQIFSASFSEQTFPFCTQTNVQDVRVINNGLCETRKEAFGKTVYTAMSPNERDCYGMGHMIPTGPIDRVINNVGCPGGAPIAGDLFTLEVQTVAGQVIVKYDGYTIFSRYPFYPNLAAGGLFVWPVREQSSSVITQGFGVCYVPKDGVSLQDIFGGSGSEATSIPYIAESEAVPTKTKIITDISDVCQVMTTAHACKRGLEHNKATWIRWCGVDRKLYCSGKTATQAINRYSSLLAKSVLHLTLTNSLRLRDIIQDKHIIVYTSSETNKAA
eukprot:sb/3468031/